MEPAEDALVPAPFLDATAARVTPLDGTWEFSELSPGRRFDAADLAGLVVAAGGVSREPRPGRCARSASSMSIANPSSTSASSCWRRRFRHDERPAERSVLVFEGLATLADVWLNGEPLLSARNMFRRHVVDAGRLLRPENEIAIHCRALGAELARRRPRGRWTTRLVEAPQPPLLPHQPAGTHARLGAGLCADRAVARNPR